MAKDILNPYGQVLYLLYIMKKPMYQKEIAISLKTITEPTVASKLNQLKEQGYVKVEEIGNINRYVLNDSGREYAKQMENQLHLSVNLTMLENDFKKRTKKIDYAKNSYSKYNYENVGKKKGKLR